MPTPFPASISCPRVDLRTWQPADANSLAELVGGNLGHLRPWMPWIAYEPQTLAERRALFAAWEKLRVEGTDVTYAIVLDDEPIGGCGLHGRIGPQGLEIGYWVGREHTRQGFATEVASALTDTAFARPEIDRVEIHHDQENRPSAGVPAALGYELVDRRPYEPTAPAESGIRMIWRRSGSVA